MYANSVPLKSFFLRSFLLFSFPLAFASPSIAKGVSVTNIGHSSILIKGGGKSVLLNPFKAVGCASGLVEKKMKVDVILASSELADEGSRNSKGIFFVQPGSYRVGKMRIEGFSAPHDRLGGRRYGMATIWKWEQAGLNFAHLGGSVMPLTTENKVLLGNPDVLIIAVGGGSKVYTGKEAARVVKELNPKRVLPVQYIRQSPIPDECDQTDVQPFLEAMNDVQVRKVGKTFTIQNRISGPMIINLMD